MKCVLEDGGEELDPALKELMIRKGTRHAFTQVTMVHGQMCLGQTRFREDS